MNAQKCYFPGCVNIVKWELYTMKTFGAPTYACTQHVGELCDKQIPTTVYPTWEYKFSLADENLYFMGRNVGEAISTFLVAYKEKLSELIEIVKVD